MQWQFRPARLHLTKNNFVLMRVGAQQNQLNYTTAFISDTQQFSCLPYKTWQPITHPIECNAKFNR